MRPLFSIIALILMTASPASAASAVDWGTEASPGPGTGAKPQPSASPGSPTRPQARTHRLTPEEKRSEAELGKAIESFNYLLKKTPPGITYDRYLLGRASTGLTLAQKIFLRSKGNGGPWMPVLLQAEKDALAVSSNTTSPARLRSEAHFVAGSAALYQGRDIEARKRFIEAIQMEPDSPNAGWMSIHIAELFFDAKEFRTALEYYRKYYSKLSRELRQIALYKTGWAFINLDYLREAEDSFVRLIKSNPHAELMRDAIRDLAYLATQSGRKEPEMLSLGRGLFASRKNNYLIYLWALSESLGAKVTSRPDSLVLAELLRTEDDAAKRLKLRIWLFEGAHREYASVEHMKAFLILKKELESAKLPVTSAGYQSIALSLESETRKLMRSYVETFSGRVQTPDPISKAEQGASLQTIFAFYEKNFPESTFLPAATELWLDVCQALKDRSCVFRVSSNALANARLKSIWKRAELDRIEALEQLAPADPEKYRPILVEALETFLKKNEGSEKWVPVAKRLAEVRTESGHPDAAIPLLESILGKEPSQDNFYRLQWARFQSEKYEETVSDTRGHTLPGPANPKLGDLVREASLKLAARAREKKDLQAYSQHVGRYLAAAPDPAKAALVRKDYATFLLENEQYSRANQEFLRIDPAHRALPESAPLLKTLCVSSLKQGLFSDVLALVPRPTGDPDLNYYQVLARLGSGKSLDNATMARMPEEKRNYVLSLTALLKSPQATRYFREYAPATSAERAIALIALRLKKDQWSFIATPKEESWVGDLLPSWMKRYPRTEAENLIAQTQRKIDRLKSGGANRLTGKALQDLMLKTKAVRASLSDSLKSRPPMIRETILQGASRIEAATAELIKSSPLPPKLTPEQEKQYTAELAGIAKEFEDQAAELAKLQAALAPITEKERHAMNDIPPARPNDDKWPWPSKFGESAHQAVKNLATSGNAMGALLALDLRKSDASLSDSEYYAARAGVLVSSQDSEALRKYVQEELTESGREDVIQSWKEAAK